MARYQPKLFPLFQFLYYLITSVWPLVHIQSFLVVTGDKTDIWLVKTVGALLLPYCILLLYITFNKKRNRIIALSLLGVCLAFLVIDLYYYFNNTITAVYLIDAFIQFIFLIYWLYDLLKEN